MNLRQRNRRSSERSSRGRATTSRRNHILRCAIESLEERAVPAILFTPNFGPETTRDFGGFKLSKEAVYFTFWGSYWNSASASPSANQIVNATKNFLASSYMANLGQYGGGVGNAYFGGFAIDGNNPKNNFSYGDLNDEVNHMVDSGALPRPSNVNGTPVYVVITPPGTLSGYDAGDAGYHIPGYDFNLTTGLEFHEMAWIGDTPSLDTITPTISHEVVEADTDPGGTGLRAFPPSAWTMGGDDEIADQEATQFTARVNGTLVQSYWSDADQAFITGGEVQGFFVRNRVLFVHGDQPTTGTLNDSITLSVVGTDEVVQENGESAVIPLSELNAVVVQNGQGIDTINIESTASGVPVTIDAGSGTNTINVDGTSNGGPVTVNGGNGAEVVNVNNTSYNGGVTVNAANGAEVVNVNNTSYGGPVAINFGFGTGTVNVAPKSQNLNNVQGAVTVKGGPNTDVLNLDDQSDPLNLAFTMTGSSIIGFGAGSVSFQGINVVTLNGGSGNVTYNVQNTEGAYPTTINTGRAGSTVNVLATSGPLQINGGPAYPNRDTVKIGNAGLMQGVLGNVTITNQSSLTAINVDDSVDPTAQNVILSTDTTHGAPYGKLTGLSSATIEYRYLNALGLTAETSLTLHTGANDVVNVQATGVATTILGKGSTTMKVGNAGSVQGILGPLTIADPTGSFDLNVDDSIDSKVLTAILDLSAQPSLFGRITGLAPAQIEYNNAQSRGLILQTGTNATVDVLASGATINVIGHGANAVNVGNAGSARGIGFPVIVSNANGLSAVTIDDSTDPTAQTVTLDTFSPFPNIVYGRVTGLASAPVLFRQGQTLSPVTLNGGTGGNTFYVLQTIQATTTVVNAGSGTNTINVQATQGELDIRTGQRFPNSTVNIGSTAPFLGGKLDGILGTVSLLSTANFTLLTVDDSGDMTPRPRGSITRTAITGLSTGAILTNHNTNGMTIWAGSGGNTFTVGNTDVATSLFSGTGNDTVYYQGSTFGNFVLDGQNGTDNVILSSTAPVAGGSLANFGAPVDIGNTAGSTHVIVDDSGDPTGRPITLTSRGVMGLGTGGIGLELGVTNLVVSGGGGGNNFTIAGTIAGTTNIGTGSGDDTVTVQATGGPIGVLGGAGTNTLVGPNANSVWDIWGPNDGHVGNVYFSSFANLTGGSSLDVFMFENGASITGTINGGGGGDWLDDSLVTTPVTVNLAAGSATGVGSLINVQNVRGGSGGDTLTGNSQGNVLIGGSGSDVITGGSGRSILIGDQGVDTIVGGAADDIIIGGSTSYDPSSLANDLALDASLAEWQSTTDSYATRVAQIRAGTGVPLLAFGLTVFDDGVANVLTGGDGTDWFFQGSHDAITDQSAGEQVN
jgi:hypothetical protein